MNILNKKLRSHPLGIWLALFALLLIFLAWIMQAYSLINWAGAVELGLQENLFTGEGVAHSLADVERGIAIADLLWALPLTIIAFWGIIKKKLIGFVVSFMVFAICVYFPLFYLFRSSMLLETKVLAIIIWALPSLLGIIGVWTNKSIFLHNEEN